MFVVSSILSLFAIFLNNLAFDLDLRERLPQAQVIDVCANSGCFE